MGVLGDAVLDFLSESSLLLFWLGGWNLLCLVLPSDTIEVCVGLMLLGVVFRVLFFYFSTCMKSLKKKRGGEEKTKRQKKKSKLLYLRVYDCWDGKRTPDLMRYRALG